MSDLMLRGVIAVGITLLGLALYKVINQLLLKRAARKSLGLDGFRPGSPAVLYFTMPGCIPCKTTQRPALSALKEITGSQVQVIEIDVVAQPVLAEQWGVLSVPTTFIIDPKGQPRRVNHGVALADKLLAQLEAVSGRSLRAEAAKSSLDEVLPDVGMD